MNLQISCQKKPVCTLASWQAAIAAGLLIEERTALAPYLQSRTDSQIVQNASVGSKIVVFQ